MADPVDPPLGASAIDRWSSTVVLGDGATVAIRPISPDDAEALAEFHVDQSAESRYRRFFSPKPTLRERDLRRFTEVDFVDRVALVVEDRGEFIAWASYERLANRSDAEVAFMVDDDHHGRGIATLLLEHMAAIAESNGIDRFTAQTLGENRAMLAVFSKAGWPVHRRFESGVIDIDFPLAATADFIDSVERREHRADSRAVARLLLPTSIAVIGASDEPGSVGAAILEHVRSHARVPVYAVNASHDVVGGQPAYRRIGDVADEVGLAVIAVPAAALSTVIDDCIAHRVRGAVVVTDVPSDAARDELVGRARRNGLRIIGPSSFGVASPRSDVELQAALVDISLPAGGVAISMQSGTLAGSLLLLASELGLGLSWFVSLGDKWDVSANDLLQFWEDDEATTAIGLYTESLGNPRKFARIARRVSASTPIVVVRTGAALVGAANSAVFEETGVIEVPTVPALLDTLRVLAVHQQMAGDRVAVISNARSPQVLATAALDAAGLKSTAFGALDWRSTSDDYERLVTAALTDADVDAVMVVHAPSTADTVDEHVVAIDRAAAAATKPVVAVMLGASDGPLTTGSDVQNFRFPEQAAAVLGRLAAYAAWVRADGAARNDHTVPDLDVTRAGSIVAEHLDDATLPPAALADLLRTYGVAMPETRLVRGPDALAAAHDLGFPVAVKALRRQAGRSVDAGVALDLTDDDDVTESVEQMQAHLGEGADEVFVQAMVPSGVDVRVRAVRDPRTGPLVTVGLGGFGADAIADESSRLAPVSPATARAMVAGTRAASLLDERRVELTADVVARVAQLVSDHDAIAELDLNPVLISDDAAWVTDATIRLASADHAPPLRRLD